MESIEKHMLKFFIQDTHTKIEACRNVILCQLANIYQCFKGFETLVRVLAKKFLNMDRTGTSVILLYEILYVRQPICQQVSLPTNRWY
jgi:hypothetical protein